MDEFVRRLGAGLSQEELKAKVYSMMMEEPEIVKKSMEHMGIDVKRFGQKRSNAQLLKDHQEAYREVSAQYLHAYEHGVGIEEVTQNLTTKPIDPCADNNIESRTPLRISELSLDTTHRGRYLRGKIVGKPIPVASVHCLLEDDQGDLVKVCMYNAVPEHVNWIDKYSYVHANFAAGRKIVVVDPYYKIAGDGSMIVRVDDYSEVLDFSQIYPKTHEEWKDEGSDLYKNNHILGAEISYSMGVTLCASTTVLHSTLLNVSASYNLLCQPEIALYFAAAAIAVDSSVSKGFFRAFKALECMKHPLAKKLRHFKKQTTTAQVPEDTLDQLMSVVMDLKIVAVKGELTVPVDDSPEELKAAGNERFKVKEYEKAIVLYRQALSKLSETAELLGNRSLCNLQLEKLRQAFLDGLASVAIDPTYVKGVFRQLRVQIAREQTQTAMDFCDKAMAIYPTVSELSQLRASIGVSVPKRASKNHYAEKVRHQRSDETGVELLTFLNNMMAGALSKGNPELMRFLPDSRVLPFHEIIQRRGLYLAGSSIDRVHKVLWNAYENGRNLRLLEVELLNDSNSFEGNEDYARSILQRLNSSNVQILKWYFSSDIGDILPSELEVFDENVYKHAAVFHSFGNVAANTTFRFGTTHVAVGCIDLGTLLSASIDGDWEVYGCLKWKGFDGSPYSVAKTMVLIELLKSTATPDIILQVAYSSCWARSTTLHFRKALQTVLNGLADSIPSDVVSILHYWKTHEVSVAGALSQWLDSSTESNSFLCTFKQKEDCIALALYITSGHIGASPEYGSTVMFAVPEFCGIKSSDENFLQSISFFDLIEQRATCKDFVAAGVRILQSRIGQLQAWVHSGAVVLDVELEQFSPGNDRLFSQVRNLYPDTMSWSNICDYMKYSDFHNMTRACSFPFTTHYMHSMNWVCKIYGASILDYSSEFKESLLQTGSSIIHQEYQELAVECYFHSPPVTHPINIGNYAASRFHCDKWTEHFFRQAPGNVEVMNVSFDTACNSLARNCMTLFLSYCHDS